MTFRIGIILLLQTAALVTMIAIKQWTLSTGTPVLLETRPVDPRSLFRGDYVRLNYTINRLLTEQLGGDDVFFKHDPIYVTLKKTDNYWQAVSIHHEQPEIPDQQVAIKGEVRYISKTSWNREIRKQEAANEIRVLYGIENYFVPEGEGMALERPKQGERVDIQVAVDRFGNAGILGILVNGKMRYRERLF